MHARTHGRAVALGLVLAACSDGTIDLLPDAPGPTIPEAPATCMPAPPPPMKPAPAMMPPKGMGPACADAGPCPMMPATAPVCADAGGAEDSMVDSSLVKGPPVTP
jgi:hypothetical protein